MFYILYRTLYKTIFISFKYPNGKTWPLLMENAHKNGSNKEANREIVDSGSWKNDQKKIFDLIIERQDVHNSSLKGGTYNPRQAWQTIDRGRTELPRHNRKDSIYQQESGK